MVYALDRSWGKTLSSEQGLFHMRRAATQECVVFAAKPLTNRVELPRHTLQPDKDGEQFRCERKDHSMLESEVA